MTADDYHPHTDSRRTDRIESAGMPEISFTMVRHFDEAFEEGAPEIMTWMQQIRVSCEHGVYVDVWIPPENPSDLVPVLAAFSRLHKKRFGCTCIVDACMTHFGRLVLPIDDGTEETIEDYMRNEEESRQS